ncbi:MAG: hypothetical protein ACXWLM_00640 [Myxococcales bacterium]
MKVVEAADNGTTGCAFDSTANELAFSTLNPTTNLGEVAAVVENRLTDTSTLNADLRTNSAQFQPHQVVVNYEVLPRTAGAAAPYTIPRQIIAAGGVVVPSSGGTGTVAAPMFLPGVLPAAAATGDFIRTTFHVEGRLSDGSTVQTNDREYLFRVCTTCTTNACL